MKKYYQLGLIIISFASLTSLLIYRNEYMKLRYVLEVLNFFGVPQGNLDDCLVLNETYLDSKKYLYLFSEPSPSWNRIGAHYIYSAFWESNGHTSHVKSLAVGPLSSFDNFACHIWVDQEDYLRSLAGKFKYSKETTFRQRQSFNDNHKLEIYNLYCEIDEFNADGGNPYGVIFIESTGNVTSKSFVPIYNNDNKEDNNLNNTAVCVRVDDKAIPKSRIVEFISYYVIVGVTDFILYDNGMHYALLNALQSLVGMKGFSRTISKLNWNFPFKDLALEEVLIEMDCLSRIAGRVGAVAVLNWDEYIVPRKHYSILSMMREVVPQLQTYEVEIKSLVCCTELKDDKRADKSWPIALRKTRCMALENHDSVLVHYPRIGIELDKQKLSPSLGAMQIYRNCQMHKKTVTTYDPIMAQFLGDLMTSKLLRIWKAGSLFTHVRKGKRDII